MDRLALYLTFFSQTKSPTTNRFSVFMGVLGQTLCLIELHDVKTRNLSGHALMYADGRY